MRQFIGVSAVVGGIALPGAAHQTRTKSVLLGELRHNQEQLTRLAALVGQLTDRLDGLDRRVADHEGATTKTLADQHLLISQLSISTQTMREDGALRATQTTQEISAVREGVRLLAEKVSQLAARSAGAE